jgi:hypothetical protein
MTIEWFERTPPSSEMPAPAFSDVASAQAWLQKQPQTMPARLQLAIAEQLECLNVQAMPGNARAAIIESLRNAAVTARDATRRKFAFQPRPPTADAAEAFTVSVRVWEAFACGYGLCLESFAAEPAVNKQRVATATHRAMITERLAIEDYFVAGVEVPAAIWRRLNRLLQVAHALEIAAVAIADPEFRDPAESSPADQYVLAALLSLADPYRLTATQYTVLHRAFSRWLNLARLTPVRDDEPRHRWIPLSLIAELPPAIDARSPEWLEVHLVRRKLRKRIESLDAGESPESLRLGRELSAASCRDLLRSALEHLRAAYGDTARALSPVGSECRLASGPAAGYELLTGKPFRTENPIRSTSSRVMHDRIAIFGAAERVEAVEKQVVKVGGEAWQLDAESAEATEISRPGEIAGARMLPGQITLLVDERTAASIAIVMRAWTCADGRFRALLRRLPGKPEAHFGYAIDLLNEPPFPVFLLPAVAALKVPASVILPSGISMRLRLGLEVRGENRRQIRLGDLIERGSDFERFALAV